MKPNEIHEVLDLTFRAREQGKLFNPCFVGPPGLGKTEIVEGYCKERNLPSVTLTSALLESCDLRGFPSVQNVGNRQRLTFATPEFWPSEGKGVIILEELNRGTTSVMNAWMALTDARRGFDNYKLPEGWIVVGCINPENEFHDVNTMDSALKDRFEMFQVEYDKKSFVDYIKQNTWDESVAMYIETGTWKYRLPQEVGNADGAKYISPRTLSKLNTAIQAGIPSDLEIEVYNTVLGKLVAKDFYKFRYDDFPVTYEEILSKRKSSLKKIESYHSGGTYKNGHISVVIKNILEADDIKAKHLVPTDLIKDVFLALPLDQALGMVNEIQFKRGESGLLLKLAEEYKEIKLKVKNILS